MNILSAFFTGVAVSANPAPQPVIDAHPVQVASIETVPDYSVTPLTEADIELYVHVMRGAADRVTHATGDDKAALDYARENHGSAPSPQTNETAALMTRATDLSNSDETIAEHEGIKKRYDAIKSSVDAQVGGESGGGAAPVAQSPQADAARKADDVLLAPHKDEILALQNQVHGFMNGQ